MFDLTLSPAQQQLIDEIRTFTDELRGLAQECELARKPSVEIVDRLKSGRYRLPTEGGRIDPVTLLLAAEEYGYADPGLATVIVGSWLPQVLGAVGPDAPTGVTSLLLFEGFGRGPSEYRTTAVPSDDGWLLDGKKEGVLHPGVAASSLVVVRQVTGDLGLFRIEGTPEGYVVVRDDVVDGKLGLRAAHTGAVRLEKLALPAEAQVTFDDPLTLARSVALARLLHASIALGSARASTDYAAAWAQKRKAFGKVIASYQGVAFVLADLATAREAARLRLWASATTLGRTSDVDVLEADVARTVAKANAVSTDAGRQGVNLLGVHGITTDHPVERWYRACAALSTLDFDPLAAALDVA
jgi:acyl-CoA dehydrogenase